MPLGVATTGAVASDQRGFTKIVDDKMILAAIKNKFSQYDFHSLMMQVSVHVSEGRVLITGNVPSQEYIDDIGKMVWSVQGVTEVMNDLIIAPRKTLQQKAKDEWIESKIESKLLLEKNLLSSNYIVDVNENVVYMIGVARNEEELARALTIASKVDGVEKVVNYVILKDDSRRTAKK